jgi:hypothetical protein
MSPMISASLSRLRAERDSRWWDDWIADDIGITCIVFWIVILAWVLLIWKCST